MSSNVDRYTEDELSESEPEEDVQSNNDQTAETPTTKDQMNHRGSAHVSEQARVSYHSEPHEDDHMSHASSHPAPSRSLSHQKKSHDSVLRQPQQEVVINERSKPLMLFQLQVAILTASPELEGSTIYVPLRDYKPIAIKAGDPVAGRALLFAMTLDSLKDLQPKVLPVTALDSDDKNKVLATGEFSLEAAISKVINKLREEREFPITEVWRELLQLFTPKEELLSLEIVAAFSCWGDSKESILVDIERMSETPPPAEEYFDEYSADINGHTLNIKVLKRKKMRTSSIENCGCMVPVDRELKAGGVGRNGNKIIFEIPSGQQLCPKGVPNAQMYNVETCRDTDDHKHGYEKIKISKQNKALPPRDENCDYFTIRIGRKGENDGDPGRLQLELKTPKPALSKKVMIDAEVQATAQEKGKGRSTRKR